MEGERRRTTADDYNALASPSHIIHMLLRFREELAAAEGLGNGREDSAQA